MAILLESGSSLLAEDGTSKVLLESDGGGSSGMMTADRHYLSTGRPEGTAVHLAGPGGWSQGGTSFTLSGAAATGSSVLTKIVNSGTTATLVIATGSTSGQLVISDGVNSVAIQVKRYRRPRWFPGL